MDKHVCEASMSPLEAKARSIFLAALECSGDEVESYLHSACAAAVGLRERVDQLVQAHRAMGKIAATSADVDSEDPPSVGDASPVGPSLERPGSTIGPYRLLEQIGEGGFGIVYMAEQLQPVRRKVALKIIKPGMDSRMVVARFEAERQALALMDHPNIAHVYDGGATETGRPYFVMELVRGIPITDFCDQNLLRIRDRIELFIAVCKAVQHAHQKGIIHRDLKPNNVLVTLHDDKPVVKVIDFGIAKAIGQQLTEKTLFTNFAAMLGTPLYMSPEQAHFSGLDVDTRADIYAMGVLLYELLTGTTPFDQQRLRTVAFDEIRRIIREETPPRPSTRLNSIQDATTTASFKRGSDPRRLSQLIRGDLDWVVMKCLEKDRNRRYETATGLALDLARFVNNQPVLARPPSLAYRGRMLIRRHRALIGTAASLSAIALIGAVMTIWQAFAAAAARDAGNRANLALSMSKQAAAEERAAEIARQLETLSRANTLIESARSHVDFGEWGKAEADLNQALRLRKDHSSVWATRGDVYARLKLLDMAAADVAHAYTLQEPGSVKSLYLHALLRLCVRDDAGYGKICELMARRFGDADDSRAWEREEVARVCLHSQTPAISPERLVGLTERATELGATSVRLASQGAALYRAGQYDLALQRLNDANKNSQHHVGIWTNSLLAMTYFRLGQPEPARIALQAATKQLARRTARWADNPTSSVAAAWWLDVQEELFFREATLLVDRREPQDDPHAWFARGQVLVTLGRPKDAIASFTRAVELDPKYAAAYLRRSELYLRLGDWEHLFRDLETRRVLEPNDPQLANDLSWSLATCPIARYRDETRAVRLAEHAVKREPEIANFWNTLGFVEYRARDWKGAMTATLKSMELSHGATIYDWYTLALCQWQLKQRDRSRQLLLCAYRRTPREADEDPFLVDVRNEAAKLIGERDTTGARSQNDPTAYALLLELQPGAAWIYEMRARASIQLKQWDQAAADMARVTEARPKDIHSWYGQAVARLGAGDLEGYRKARRGIIANFRADTNPVAVSHVCYVSAALPAAPSEAESLLQMAEFAVARSPNNPRLRGAMNYRNGRYEAAIADFDQATTVFPRRAWDWLFIAMARQMLGQSTEARKAVAEAEDWIERTNRSRSGETTTTWIGWFESIEVAQILKEAKELIQ
jgi:eukaryotic-like serine/threonine-protein kinase